jgi:hypothetical protein
VPIKDVAAALQHSGDARSAQTLVPKMLSIQSMPHYIRSLYLPLTSTNAAMSEKCRCCMQVILLTESNDFSVMPWKEMHIERCNVPLLKLLVIA